MSKDRSSERLEKRKDLTKEENMTKEAPYSLKRTEEDLAREQRVREIIKNKTGSEPSVRALYRQALFTLERELGGDNDTNNQG